MLRAVSALSEGPSVTERSIVFTVPDPDGVLAGVTLYQEVQRPRLAPPFARNGDGAWTLDFPRPDADRLEYLLQLTGRDGGSQLVPDPANPRRASGPFGDKSVVELPGYEAPGWTTWDEPLEGAVQELSLPTSAIRGPLKALLWTSAGATPGELLPLLVAHDGPEYASHSGLLAFLDRLQRRGRLPAMRAALIAPVDRDETYSASALYARAMVRDVLPALERSAPTPRGLRFRIGMGASLGALAMLHLHRRHPAAFGALFLQSGSYFRPRSDRQESGFGRFRRISAFVGEVLAARDFHAPVPVAITCGTIEENLANNLAVRGALAGQGYPVRFRQVRDGHTWTCWRDAMEPDLEALLADAWGST
jgi:enterochelin esterase family protein